MIDTQPSATNHTQRSSPASQPIRSPWANTLGAPGTDSVARKPSAMQSAPASSSVQITANLSGVDTAKLDDWLINAATIAAESTRDPAGRLVLRTRSWFDPHAPRCIALDVPEGRKLGGIVVTVVAILVLGLILAVFGSFFFAILVGVVSVQIGRPLLKTALQSIVAAGTPVRVSDLR